MNLYDDAYIPLVVVILVAVTVIVVVIGLFGNQRCGIIGEEKTCTEKYCHKLKEHDYKYSIAILLLGIVFISTITMADDKKLSEYISFSSSISSIILSILAIILTLLSEAKNEAVQSKIDIFIDNIKVYSKQSEDNIKKAESILKKFQEFDDKLEEVIKSQREMKAHLEKFGEKTVSKAFNRNDKKQWKDIEK